MKPRASRLASFSLLFLASFAVSAPAQGPTETTAQRWWRELGETRRLLLAGEVGPAREVSRRLTGELIEGLKAGGPANELTAVALAQLALAEAGLEGLEEDAAWHLEIAALFNPAFEDAAFEEFGDLGERLLAARRRRAEADPAAGKVLPTAPVPGLVPPVPLESPHMIFRASREVLEALDPELKVSFVVDSRGRVRRPTIEGRLDNPAPVLLSLDLLRGWRFEPARIGERAVPVSFRVELPLTEGAVRRAEWELGFWRVSCLLAGEEPRAAREAAGRLLLEIESSPAAVTRDRARGRALAVLRAIDREIAGSG